MSKKLTVGFIVWNFKMHESQGVIFQVDSVFNSKINLDLILVVPEKVILREVQHTPSLAAA